MSLAMDAKIVVNSLAVAVLLKWPSEAMRSTASRDVMAGLSRSFPFVLAKWKQPVVPVVQATSYLGLVPVPFLRNTPRVQLLLPSE